MMSENKTVTQAEAPEAQAAQLEGAFKEAWTLLAPIARAHDAPAAHRLDVTLEPEDLPTALQALIDAQWGYLATITGVDLGPEAGVIEVLYHVCARADVLWLRVHTPREAAEVPTICGVIPSASFYERELSEMLGVTVRGTPDPRLLFLPDEWPADVYPLRKDFEPSGAQSAGEGAEQ